MIKAFLPDGPVVALDLGVLPRLAGLDVQDRNPCFSAPIHQFFTDVLGRYRREWCLSFSAIR